MGDRPGIGMAQVLIHGFAPDNARPVAIRGPLYIFNGA